MYFINSILQIFFLVIFSTSPLLLFSCYFFSCYFISCYFFSYFPTVTFFPVTFFPVTFFPVTFFPTIIKDRRLEHFAQVNATRPYWSLSDACLRWLYVFSSFLPPFPPRPPRPRRKDFCLSRQNHLCQTVHIWGKEYIDLGKCTGWPFHDLDPRSRLWHWLTKICLSARSSNNNSFNHYKTW